jgi:hypothetical protein
MSHILLGISLGVVLLDHMADLCLVFLEASMVFFIVCDGSFFPASSLTFDVGGVLDSRNSNRSEVES